MALGVYLLLISLHPFLVPLNFLLTCRVLLPLLVTFSEILLFLFTFHNHFLVWLLAVCVKKVELMVSADGRVVVLFHFIRDVG